MKIVTAKYQDEESNWVALTFDDGSVGGVSTTDGIRRQYTDMFNDWIADGGVVEPQYTVEELEAQKIAQDRAEAQAYLASTDWYVMRKAETGKDIPAEVEADRVKARLVAKVDEKKSIPRYSEPLPFKSDKSLHPNSSNKTAKD